MNDKNINLKENAKDDWLARARAHRRKQKGLPALSTLNTDAGNVEHNVSMFNHMSTPIEGPTNNPVSGPFGGDVSAPSTGGGMGESLCEGNKPQELVYLYYPELQLSDMPTGRVFRGNYYEPDEYETKDITIEYEYETDKDSVFEVLQDIPELQEELNADELSDEEFAAKIDENFDELLEKYMSDVLDYFEELAIDRAERDFDPESYFGESVVVRKNDFSENLDDKFDMSMRTLL